MNAIILTPIRFVFHAQYDIGVFPRINRGIKIFLSFTVKKEEHKKDHQGPVSI